LALDRIVNSPFKKVIRPVWKIIKKKRNLELKDFTTIVSVSQNNKKLKVIYNTTFQSDLMFLKRKIKNWEIKWNKGVFENGHTNENLLYFHFILSKNSGKFKMDPVHEKINSFYMQPSGIKIKE